MFQKYQKDFALLLESGFIAINQTDADSAKKIFAACNVLKPNNAFGDIGFAFLYLHLLDLSKALTYCQNALKKDSKNEMANTIMGICKAMTLKQSPEGEKILIEMAKSDNTFVKKSADIALQFIDKFIKKAPSPVELAQPVKKGKEKRK